MTTLARKIVNIGTTPFVPFPEQKLCLLGSRLMQAPLPSSSGGHLIQRPSAAASHAIKDAIAATAGWPSPKWCLLGANQSIGSHFSNTSQSMVGVGIRTNSSPTMARATKWPTPAGPTLAWDGINDLRGKQFILWLRKASIPQHLSQQAKGPSGS